MAGTAGTAERRPSEVTLIFGGDAMLGRLVALWVERFGPSYPLGDTATRLRAADLAVVNLECALTERRDPWSGPPKPFYFRGVPQSVQGLLEAGIDAVNLANNHALDFGPEGLGDTLRLLRRNGIHTAGAGMTLSEARRPAVAERAGLRVGLVGYCDHQPDFAAGEARPGIAFLDLERPDRALERVREDLAEMRRLGVDWPVLSLHWGPNFAERPSPEQVAFAHQAIEAGFATIFGHSAHGFQGVEVWRGCPILYAAGDLVDDYRIHRKFRNDRQLLYELVLRDQALDRIRLWPIEIAECQTGPASPEANQWIGERMARLCAELGSHVQPVDGHWEIAAS